jgi:glycyl-tRNA synthetase beta chain
VGLRVHDDGDLVAEHVELVEYPGLLCGAIEERFLELPPEVVVSTLRHHQKCLILETEEGELRPHFLAVIDRRDDPEGLVRQGNEWVIGARLADAGFFFAEDRKTLLATRADGLSRVEWHRRLGSMADKAQRIGELAGHLSDRVDAGFDVDTLTLIARLAKADLVTHMVGEFPELQGIMGGHYLRLEGEREAVWTAARDHYRPIGFDGELPASVEGRLVGAADRLDTVAALFALGEKPSGSKDPFGLRRAAQGLVRIVAESGWDVALDDVVRTAVVPVAKAADSSTDEVMAAVLEFLASRVRRYLVEVVGVAGDTAEAVMAADWTRLPVLVERAHALEEVRSLAQFRALALAFKRVRNITANQPDGEVDPRLFEHDAESELHRAVETYHRQLSELVPEHRIDEIFRAMEPIASTLDRFFVDVLVMAKDERVRANRIALLKALGRDFLALADLSKLHIEGGEA